MQMRWRLALPAFRLIAFLAISFQSYRGYAKARNRYAPQYFYWSTVVLDRNPPNRHSKSACVSNEPCWDAAMIDHSGQPPDLLERAFILSAMPAFLIGLAATYVLGSYGVNEVLTFMISLPPLLAAWFYLLGHLIDRRRIKQSSRRSTSPRETP